MKTNIQTSDKQLTLHDIHGLRQRLTAGPPNDKAKIPGAADSDSASGLSSASGLMIA